MTAVGAAVDPVGPDPGTTSHVVLEQGTAWSDRSDAATCSGSVWKVQRSGPPERVSGPFDGEVAHLAVEGLLMVQTRRPCDGGPVRLYVRDLEGDPVDVPVDLPLRAAEDLLHLGLALDGRLALVLLSPGQPTRLVVTDTQVPERQTQIDLGEDCSGYWPTWSVDQLVVVRECEGRPGVEVVRLDALTLRPVGAPVGLPTAARLSATADGRVLASPVEGFAPVVEVTASGTRVVLEQPSSCRPAGAAAGCWTAVVW